MPGKLTQRLVTRYAKLAALQNAIEKWLAAKRDEILPALLDGGRCPAGGPYLLQVSIASAPPAWKEEFRAYLIEQGKSEDAAEGILVAIAARPRAEQPRLLSKVNPTYRGAVRIALPYA